MPHFEPNSDTSNYQSRRRNTSYETNEDIQSENSFTETSDTEGGELEETTNYETSLGEDCENGSGDVENDMRKEREDSVSENENHMIVGHSNGGGPHEAETNGSVTNGHVKTKTRAASAKDLVKSQERLVSMLQHMKNDLSRMDREATSIKEEVARSRQLFDVVVSKKKIHQLNYTANGYNISHAMPRVSYSTFRSHSSDSRRSSFRHYRTSSPSSADISRRSSWSDIHKLNSDHLRQMRSGINSGQDSLNSSQCVTSQSEYSDTENEYEARRSRDASFDLNRSRVSISGMSSASYTSDTSMTTDRSRRQRRRTPDTSGRPPLPRRRRSSYFFTPKSESPQQDLSDDVCV